MKYFRWFMYFFISLVIFVIALPNHTTCGGSRYNLSSVKSNAHTLQTVIETYAVDWGGQLPSNVKNLKLEASQKGYWKDFKNPFDHNKEAVRDLHSNSKINESTGEIQTNNFETGTVYYAPVKEKDVIKKYFLYGASKENNKLIVDKGQVFYLSNN